MGVAAEPRPFNSWAEWVGAVGAVFQRTCPLPILLSLGLGSDTPKPKGDEDGSQSPLPWHPSADIHTRPMAQRPELGVTDLNLICLS